MKASIFGTNIVYGVDYTNREDCTAVIDITEQDFAEIKAGTKIINIETLELEVVELPVVEEELDEVVEEVVVEVDEEE